MKVLIPFFFTISCIAQTAAHTNHYSNTSNAAIWLGGFSTTYAPPNLLPGIATWGKQRYDLLWIGGGANTGANTSQTYTAGYTDIAVVANSQWYEIQAAAAAAGMQFEGMILHSSIDMQWVAGYPYSGIDSFDAFDVNPVNNGLLLNGLITYSNGIYTDVSNTFPTTISSTLYIGYQVPFDQANFTISTAAAGGSVAFNYWTGTAWTALSRHFSDGTSGLTTSGKVSWYPPSDWAATSVNSSHVKYWVQVVVTGASSSPVYSALKGDNWAVASGSNNARGWNATDPNRINVGTPLEYNPTPPANATAKFQYQGRLPNAFYTNFPILNPSNKQDGKYSAAKFLAYDIEQQLTPPYNYNSAIYDDAGRYPCYANPTGCPGNVYPGPTLVMANVDCNQSPDPVTAFAADQVSNLSQAISDLKAEYGTNFAVGTNNYIPYPDGVSSFPIGDVAILEGFTTPYSWHPSCTFWLNPVAYAGPSCPYDSALPANNPNNVKLYVQTWDRWAFQAAWAPQQLDGPNSTWSTWHYMDQSNRTPMELLALNYIGSNPNTGFAYFGGPVGLNGYYFTDQVYVNQTPVTLTADVPKDTSMTTTKTFSVASTADCYGQFLRLGAQGSPGEMVWGEFGRVLYASMDYTWNFSTGGEYANTNGTALSGYPTVLSMMYSAPFTSLNITMVVPRSSGPIAPYVWQYWNGSAWTTLSVTDTTNSLANNGTVTWVAPSDWAATSETSYDPGGTGRTHTYTGYEMRVTFYDTVTVGVLKSPTWLTMDSLGGIDSSTPVYSTSLVYQSFSSGDTAYCVARKHLSVIPSPAVSHVQQWVRWFPAMGVDLGIPNTSGVGGGARVIPWKTGGAPDNISGNAASCDAGGTVCSDLWRRDFTNAIVLFRPWSNGINGLSILESELDTYSVPIPLGGTYYPLNADGTTSAGTTRIELRGGEAAILMTTPMASGPVVRGGGGRSDVIR